MINKLIAITNQLLDLGKRNRLLNYKDTGLKTLKILNRNIEELFRGIKAYKEFPIFNIEPVLNKYQKEINADSTEEDTLNYTDDEVYDICRKFINIKDLICYKRGYALSKTLKALIKDFRFSIIEKGINALYISFGFIHYKEEEEEYVAPLLLIPVELNNDTGDYIIRQYEDEILLNPTLRYYFSAMLQVELPLYNDDNLLTFFNKVEDVLPEGTYLEKGISLGIYSFYKMNMYNDLIQNKENVILNDNIRRILGDTSIYVENPKEDKPIYPVVNCDSSQQEAIQFAANGKSFCLQGPPGSGKSQTITNIIASLLGEGKKILFVSEKIAALKVVYENLRRAKLNDFAIELHSNKANKKEFIENLYKTATLPKYEIDFKSRAYSAHYNSIKAQLHAYESELHAVIPSLGQSLLDLYAEYLKLDVDVIDFNIDVEDTNLYNLEKVISLFNIYIRRSDNVGYDYRKSALYGLIMPSEAYIYKDLNQDLFIAIRHINNLIKYKNLLNSIADFNIKSIEDAYSKLMLVEKVLKLKTFNPNYLIKRNRARLIEAIDKYLDTTKDLDQSLISLYDNKIFNEDIDYLHRSYKELNKGLFKSKEFKELNEKLLGYRREKAKPQEIEAELLRLVKQKQIKLMASSSQSIINALLGNIDDASLKTIYLDLKAIDNTAELVLSQEQFDKLKASIELPLLSQDPLKGEMMKFYNISKLFPKEYKLLSLPLEDVLAKLNEIDLEKKNFNDYAEINDIIAGVYKYKALDFLNHYLDNNYEIKNLSLCYKKLFFKQTIDMIVSQSQLLSSFKSLSEDELIADFRELDERLLNINRDIIIAKNSQNRPDDAIIEGSEFKILDKEFNKSRRQLPIRQLLEQTFELCLDIKPVFLMSPLSVSTYLACKVDMFDCVIFDEASQIFASDALGAIYRAKQCIIIGDTKQMPPTSFFQAGVDDINDKEYDLESILDKATQTFETTSLKWHYRSRSEELITFSNMSFYDSNLITIPQSKKHETGFGVDFAYVAEGRYDTNTRTNPIEANKVCDMVFEHVKTSKKSLGVVAFSNVQAELIQTLVERRLKKEPEYQELFDEQIDEPFFVKNLESVQGDERDRIIFSICYGYNNENKFYQRFGPLNNQGGERRLNVAITRAKYNITVVSSVKYNDIKPSESLGVQLLRSYLEFAENVVTNKNYNDSENGVINSVREYVESLGYEVYSHYGSSSFKIDLAIKKDNEFILAIMLDSKNKYSSNISDKYRLEKLLLERLGWKYYRLYATAWVNNFEIEKAKLKEVLEGTYSLPEREFDADATYLKVDKSVDALEASFMHYDSISIDKAKDILKYNSLEYLVSEILRIEAPIHKEHLYKKIAYVYDKAKPTPAIIEEVDSCISRRVLKSGDFFVRERGYHVRLRLSDDRDILHINEDEIVDGMTVIVNKHNGITVDGLYKTLVQMLGHEKVLAQFRKYLDEILEKLLKAHVFIKKKDSLYKN